MNINVITIYKDLAKNSKTSRGIAIGALQYWVNWGYTDQRKDCVENKKYII